MNRVPGLHHFVRIFDHMRHFIQDSQPSSKSLTTLKQLEVHASTSSKALHVYNGAQKPMRNIELDSWMLLFLSYDFQASSDIYLIHFICLT